jgi:hypothetical protein
MTTLIAILIVWLIGAVILGIEIWRAPVVPNEPDIHSEADHEQPPMRKAA